MIYDIKSDRWDFILYATKKEREEDFRIVQDAIFDELDELYEKKYGYPYFTD